MNRRITPIFLYILALSVGLFLFYGCQKGGSRKIRLADKATQSRDTAQSASSVLQVSAEKQHSVAIFQFKNRTKNNSLDWLQRGLADMLIADLSQSPYMNVIPLKRLGEFARRLGKNETALGDPLFAATVAREVKAEIMLGGKFYQQGNQLFIDVEMREPVTARVIRIETVSGEHMENIFEMVDQLSEKVRGDIRGDLENLQKIGPKLSEMTNSVEAFRCYSKALELQGKFLQRESEKCLRQAIKQDTTFAASYLRYAKVKFSLGQTDSAMWALSKAKRYKDKLSAADRLELELTYTQLEGNYNKIIPILEKAVKQFPNDIDIHLQLARVYRNLRHLDRAFEEFEIALEMDPGRKLIYNDLGYLFAERGEFTTAFKYFDTYQKLAPDEPNPYDSKGEILMQAGKLREAAKELETALQKWPDFYYSLNRLGEIYTELGDYTKALRYANRALAANNSTKMSSHLKLQKARYLWRFGKINAAETVLKNIQKEEPLLITSAILSAEIFRAKGDSASATRVLHSIFEKYKDRIESEKSDGQEIEVFLKFLLMAKLPAREVVPILEKLKYYQEKKMRSITLPFVLGLNYLQVGKESSARKCFGENERELLDLLVMNRQGGWGGTWKYVLSTLNGNPDNPFLATSALRELRTLADEDRRKDLRVLAEFAVARYRTLIGEESAVEEIYHKQGSATEKTWRVIGPFAYGPYSGFYHQYPPEKEIDLGKSYPGDGGKISWQPAQDDFSDGYVNFDYLFKQSNWAVGYAALKIISPDRRKVQIRLGADEACRLWLNDQLIWQRYLKKDALIDRDIVTVMLHPGENTVLLKVTNTDQDWGFYFRVTDGNGNGFSDISFQPPGKIAGSLAKK